MKKYFAPELEIKNTVQKVVMNDVSTGDDVELDMGEQED